jgi:signal peptidase I
LNSLFSKILYGSGVIFDLAKWLILILIILSLINAFFVGVFVVDGESMSPNFKDKELVFWRKGLYRDGNVKPERGDIVVVLYPGDPKHKVYVKRIIGLPNEKIEVKDGKVYINNKLYREKYLNQSLVTEPSGVWNIGNSEYFVMGDNRPNSNDSRFFGAIEKRFVLGKALGVIFPRFRVVSDI